MSKDPISKVTGIGGQHFNLKINLCLCLLSVSLVLVRPLTKLAGLEFAM